MSTNKEIIYEFIQKNLISGKDSGYSTSEIAEEFDMQRSNTSKVLNELVKEGRLNKLTGRPVRYALSGHEHDTVDRDVFKSLVGDNGSLKKAIQIAQAAVLYPNESLNILVSSQRGSGRTSFVEKIFEYALKSGVVSKESELVKVNCKFYTKDSSALTEVLFCKQFYDSAFYKARNGVLFIDNAELLSAKDTEKINYLLKTGRLEEENYDLSDTLIIVGVSKESKDLFLSNIPMMIELPEYHEKPIPERLELINQFFYREAKNSNRLIEVGDEVVKALMIHQFPNNVKELEIEIKNLCAKAFVRTINSQSHSISVNENDLTIKTRSGLLNIKQYQQAFDNLLGNSELIYYDSKNSFQLELNQSNLSTEDVYESLNHQYNELSSRGFDSESIGSVMDNHIKNLFSKYNYFRIPNEEFDLSNLTNVVAEKVLIMVNDFIEMCKIVLKRHFTASVVYGLCLHINSLTERDFKKNRISNDQIMQVIQDYPEEYAISLQFSRKIKKELGVELPMEEVIIISMFLIEPAEDKDTTRPVLLYIFHGVGVASSLMNVTNNLTQLNNSYSYDLDLSKDPKDAVEEIEQLVYEIDEGKGIVVIYDMGSIKTMIDTIIEKTTIKIRAIQFPITLIGMEIARNSVKEDNIDTIYHQAMNDIFKIAGTNLNKVSLIITLCYTSEGGAVQLKQYIDQYSKLNYKTIALSVASLDELSAKVTELRKFYNIRAFVGTFDPKLFGIPYISVHDIFSVAKENLDKALTFSPNYAKSSVYDAIYRNLEEQLMYTSMVKLKNVLPRIIDNFVDYYALNENSSIGLFMHLASLIERILSGGKSEPNCNTDSIIEQFPEDYQFVLKHIRPIEKEFNLIVNDHEIATVMMIVKRL